MPDPIKNVPSNIDDTILRHAKQYSEYQQEILDNEKYQKKELKEIAEWNKKNLSIERDILAEKKKYEKADANVIKDLEHQLKARMKFGEVEIKYREKNIELSNLALDKAKALIVPTRGIRDDLAKLLATTKNIPNLSEKFNLSELLGQFRFGQYIGKLMSETLGQISAKTAGLLIFAKALGKEFLSWDSSLTGFRKEFGLVRGQETAIRKDAIDITKEFASMGVRLETSLSTIIQMSKYFGGLWNYSKALAGTLTLLQTSLGISADSALGMMRNMAVLGGGLIENQQTLLLNSKLLANAAGQEWSSIVSDIAGMNDVSLAMISKIPSVIVKTAVALRRMGTDIQSSAQASRHLLDFTQNVGEEMEASVLLGRSINLQRARELAYSGNLEASTAEILRLTKAVNFNKLDVFQQEAFARATGRGVGELLNMLQTSKQLEHIQRNGTAEQKAQLKLYNDLREQNKLLNKDSAERVLLGLKEKSNQEYATAISDKWHSILVSVESVIYPIVSGVLSIVPALMDIIKGTTMWYLGVVRLGGIISRFAGKFGFVQKLMGSLGGITMRISKFLMPIANFFDRILPAAGKFGAFIGRIFGAMGGLISKLGWFGKLIGIFGKLGVFALKFLEPIGWVILAAQVIYSAWKRFSDMFSSSEWTQAGFWKRIWMGIKAIGGVLYDVLISPFVDAYKWIKGIFMGSSPSQIALGIVQGFISVQAMLFDVITYPFRQAMGFITNLFGMKSLSEKIKGGLSGIMGNKPVEKSTIPQMPKENMVEKKSKPSLFNQPIETKAGMIVPAVQITPTPTKIEGTKEEKPKSITPAKEEESMSTKMDKLIAEMCGLRAELNSGKILSGPLVIDGQEMSATLARQTSFRGGYGTNHLSTG